MSRLIGESGLYEIYNKKDGIRLETWLNEEENLKEIENMRLLYIIKPNLDDKKTNKTKSIYKFGIAGIGGSNPANRLKSYVIDYGHHSKKNPAAGVMLYFLAGTKYNAQVDPTKSKVKLREKFIKSILKKDELISENRGDERTFADLNYIKSLVAVTTPKAPPTEQEVVRTIETRGYSRKPQKFKDFLMEGTYDRHNEDVSFA